LTFYEKNFNIAKELSSKCSNITDLTLGNLNEADILILNDSLIFPHIKMLHILTTFPAPKLDILYDKLTHLSLSNFNFFNSEDIQGQNITDLSLFKIQAFDVNNSWDVSFAKLLTLKN